MDGNLKQQLTANAVAWDTQAREAWEEGDFTRSRQLFEKVLAAWRSIGRTEEIEYALLHITQAMRLEPEYNPSKARPLLEEALQLAQEIGTDRYIKPAQLNLAWLDIDTGNYATAFTAMQQLLSWWIHSPDKPGTCLGLENIAKALIGLNMMEPALRIYAAATANREQQGMQHTVAAYITLEKRYLSLARNQLGATKSAVLEAEGRNLTLEQAVAYALSITLPTNVDAPATNHI